MNNYNVFGDLAGNKKTLDALLAKMPQDAIPLSLGDMNDRGPSSKDVIEFFRQNGKAVNSNHGHMFVDWYKGNIDPTHEKFYEPGIFLGNGGRTTTPNYFTEEGSIFENPLLKEHIEYLENLPMYIETDKYFFSHAPLPMGRTKEQASNIGTGFYHKYDSESDYSLLWNRYVPERPHPDLNGKLMVFGHNSSNMVKVFTPKFPFGKKIMPEELDEYLPEAYAMCIDTSGGKVLTGLHLPTMKLYQQEYID